MQIDSLSIEYLLEVLPDKYKNNIELFDTIESTNKEMLGRLKNGLSKDNSIILANSQWGGVGRNGKSFYSPNDTGVYFSVLLDLNDNLEKYSTILASIAAARAAENISGKTAMIKWVNDIYVMGKKVAGILAQSHTDRNGKRSIVLGVGCNIYEPLEGFPENIKDRAGYLIENRKDGLKAEFVSEFLVEITKLAYSNQLDIYEEYKKRSNLLNREVYIMSKGGETKVKVIDIDSDFYLVVEDLNGITKSISSGEVSLRI